MAGPARYRWSALSTCDAPARGTGGHRAGQRRRAASGSAAVNRSTCAAPGRPRRQPADWRSEAVDELAARRRASSRRVQRAGRRLRAGDPPDVEQAREQLPPLGVAGPQVARGMRPRHAPDAARGIVAVRAAARPPPPAPRRGPGRLRPRPASSQRRAGTAAPAVSLGSSSGHAARRRREPRPVAGRDSSAASAGPISPRGHDRAAANRRRRERPGQPLVLAVGDDHRAVGELDLVAGPPVHDLGGRDHPRRPAVRADAASRRPRPRPSSSSRRASAAACRAPAPCRWRGGRRRRSSGRDAGRW